MTNHKWSRFEMWTHEHPMLSDAITIVVLFVLSVGCIIKFIQELSR
jgi:hypothetical protein